MASSVNQKAGKPGGFVRHAAVVSGLTLVSRLTGLVRDAVLAAALGLGIVADAFFIGFLVPNLFRRLFGEGALTAAFIPQYTEMLAKDEQAAARFAKLMLSLLGLVTSVIVVVGEVALWSAWHWGGGEQWPEKIRWAVELTAVMLPYLPLVCVTALLGAVLQVHGRFGLPAAAPLVLNAAIIGAAAWGLRNGWPSRDVAGAVGIAVVLAGVVQVLWQGSGVLRHLRGSGWTFAGAGAPMKATLLMMGPMLLGLAVFQINAMLDSLIAYSLSPTEPGLTNTMLLGDAVTAPMDTGAVAALQWSQRLYQFPLGVFGIAIATAIFPALATAAARSPADPDQDDSDRFVSVLRRGLRLTIFISLPASVGLIVVREPLVRVVYEHGKFSADDARRVAWILTGYAASVWAYSLTHVLTRAFYALKDAKTPVRVSVGMVSVNLTLNLLLIWPLGAAGLAWSTAVSGAGQGLILLWLLGRRPDVREHDASPIVDASVRGSWLRTALSTVAMAAAAAVVVHFAGVWQGGFGRSLLVLTAAVAGGGAVYLLAAWALGMRELHDLRRH